MVLLIIGKHQLRLLAKRRVVDAQPTPAVAAPSLERVAVPMIDTEERILDGNDRWEVLLLSLESGPVNNPAVFFCSESA